LGEAKAQSLKTNQDSVSYALGMDIGKSLSSNGIEVDVASFLKGLETTYKGGDALFGEEEKMRIIKDAFNKAAERRIAKLQAAETAFFASIKTNPNIKHLQDGLYYEVISEGSGAKPTMDDEISVHYKGALANGTEFDNSYDRGQPLDLDLGRVIK